MRTIGQILLMMKDETNPLILELLEYIKEQGNLIQDLKDEVAILKGQNARPKIKPSNLEKDTNKNRDDEKEKEVDNEGEPKKRAGSKKRSKKLKIDEERVVQPDFIPKGSIFKGYQYFIVQEMVTKVINIRYCKAKYLTPDGESIVGKLDSSHFGSNLRVFILYQYHHCHVTQPLIFEQLQDYGIEISKGQINNIIIENKDLYHLEKDMILSVGLKYSNFVNVDDTGARHDGKNGYCTHIGNDFFAWFKSTGSKSRINFLELLRGVYDDYVLNTEALSYMESHKLPKSKLSQLSKYIIKNKGKIFENKQAWLNFLQTLGITQKSHIKVTTEGVLLGSFFFHDFNKNLVIVSDNAGQFDVLQHALCWVHAERTIEKLLGFSEHRKQLIVSVRDDIWKLYSGLKDYQDKPTADLKSKLEQKFDEIFKQKTGYASLDLALKRIFNNKSELLMILKRPELPLHNNLSERDIREYVKKRKISGSTRSINGQTSRDTFTSIKKTCRKLGVSFWKYLLDRVENNKQIPLLSDIMIEKMRDSLVPI